MTESGIYLAFGKAVAARRTALGFTQERLAAKVGISRASLANIERGRQNVLLHHVYGLAAALDLPKVGDLLPPAPENDPAVEIVLSKESEKKAVTDHGKVQLSKLIETALAQRAKKVGS